MCHVFTVFTFTPSAKHAYRSIASFVRNVLKVPGADPFQDLFKPAANESSNSNSESEGKGLAKEKCILNDDVVEESRGLYSGIQITEDPDTIETSGFGETVGDNSSYCPNRTQDVFCSRRMSLVSK